MGDNFKIYFVKPEKNGENNKTLCEAFEALNKTEYNLKPEWITAQKCLEADGKGHKTFIFDPFEGAGFEHIKNCGYRIYGPRCILANLQHGMDLPRRKRQPVYNLAMKDMRICCTSLEGIEREEITEKVHLMGGIVERNLTGDVTHLVAGEVGSNKYMVAVDNGKSVMTKEWISKVWELSQDKHILATDETFQKYVCPPLLGVTVVVSGFKAKERNQMRSFVVGGGGKYSGELRMNECTHLIVKEPQGAKYEAAKNWHIKIVKDRWLYDCMDKGRFLDPKPYQFVVDSQPKTVLTSTPEKRSAADPSISDISAITNTGMNTSMQHVDETTNMTSIRFSEQFSTLDRRSDIAETKIVATGLDSDLTVTSADVFLDGCQIYLSGIKPAVQEKLKKIITAGCGLRSMEIRDSTTHVVVGEIVPSDVMTLNSLAECPHVVTVDWLMDCFYQHCHLSEENYFRHDLGLKLPSKSDRYLTKSLEVSKQKVQLSREETKMTKSDTGSSKKGNVQESQAFRPDAPSDLEMVELLSQYIETQDPRPDSRMIDNEVQVVTKNRHEDVQKVTVTAIEVNEEDALTQDPNDVGEDANVGIFSKMKFIILGFEEDEAEQLITLIEAKGGSVLPSTKTRQVADIAVVPLLGFPVNVTVSEILTNAWLQMCVEEDQLLPYDGWLCRPLEVPEAEPLTNCCISVSGYAGVERECILHLAQILGADCQEHFARKPRKGVAASTHLVVSYPSGTKYEAAKKWKIPAVGREWICACLETGEKVLEEEYLIEKLVEKSMQPELTNLETVRSTHSSTSSLPTPAMANVDHHDDVPQHRADRDDHVAGGEAARSSEVSVLGSRDKMQNASYNEELPVKMSHRKEDLHSEMESNKKVEVMPASSAESSDSATDNVMDMNPMSEFQRHLSLTPVSSKRKSRSSGRNSAFRPNQSENITAGCLKTPVEKQRQKWGQITNGDSPSASTPQGLIHGGRGETPRTFMQPNFKPKFNLNGIFTTPDGAIDLNKSTPLGETFRRQISKAVQNVTSENVATTVGNDADLAPSQSLTDNVAPLRGVVIAVAKKLGRSHEQYNSVVVDLGGNYSWHSGPHVTHFIFQGRPNDTNKEFRKAREEKKIIVSPYWLFACKETNCRVDESLFPHNYNPNLSLTMTPASKATPSRSCRSASKPRGKFDSSSKPVLVTPARKMNALEIQEGSEREAASKAFNLETDNNGSPESHNDSRQEHAKRTKTLEQPIDGDSSAAINVSVNEECIADIDVSHEDSVNKSVDNEMKEAVSKTLGNILSDSTRSKRSSKKRTSKKLSGQPSTSEGNTSQESVTKAGTSGWTAKGEVNQDVVITEPSQSMQVNWEDSTARLEKEKLAFRLDHPSEATQNTDELMAAIEIPSEKKERNNVASKSKRGTKDVTIERPPIPEPPPLAFPTSKPSNDVPPLKPIELLNEECIGSKTTNGLISMPVFLISGMQNQERLDYAALVEQLGGTMIEKQHYDTSCTHLVVSQPSRNEKYLSSLASGKWILHKSYFEACRAEGKFVKEESHEWGSNFTVPLMQKMSTQASKLAAAAYKWRKKIETLKKLNPSCQGAYDGWKVLLCLDKAKEENFQRLLEAGGAEVSLLKSPFPDQVQGTHAFIDLTKTKILEEDLRKLLNAGIHCLKPEFIPAFLTDDPAPDPSEFYPAEFIELKERQNQTRITEPQSVRKRRRTKDDCTSTSKTPRR